MLFEVTNKLWIAAVGKRLLAGCRRSGAIQSVEASERIRFLSAVETPTVARVAILTDDKKLITYHVESGDVPNIAKVDETKVPKRGTAITRLLLNRGETSEAVLVVSDKWGEVTAFPDPHVSTKKRALMTHTGCLVTSLVATSDSKYIISADREERIRVSHFPHAFDIQSFCLGHSRFVSTMTIPQCDLKPGAGPSSAISSDVAADEKTSATSISSTGYAAGQLLLSGGADGTLRLFHWMTGTLLHTLYFKPGERISFGPRYIFEYKDGETYRVEGTAIAPGANTVYTGLYGSYTSALGHADADMNEGGIREEDENGGDDAGGEAIEEDEPSAKRMRAEETSEPKHSDADAGADAEPKDAGDDTGADDSLPLIPKALGSFMPRQSGPPVFPVVIAESGSSGLFATFIDGEHAIRIVQLCMDEHPAHTPVSVGHSTPASLPQARVVQVGATVLPQRPLHLKFDPNEPSILYVSTVKASAVDATRFVYAVTAYKLQRSDVAAPVDATNVLNHYTLSEIDGHDTALSVCGALSELETIDSAAVDDMRASYFADKLEEYDKNIKLVKSVKPGAQR